MSFSKEWGGAPYERRHRAPYERRHTYLRSPGCVEEPQRYHAERARQDDSKLLIDQLGQLAAAVIDGDGVGTIHETRINEERRAHSDRGDRWCGIGLKETFSRSVKTNLRPDNIARRRNFRPNTTESVAGVAYACHRICRDVSSRGVASRAVSCVLFR